MVKVTIPGSKDIYIEVNAKKIAIVESYKVRSSCDSHYIEAFGESEPVGTIAGRTRHTIELSRVYICGDAASSHVNFYELSDFNLVVVKPDRKIIYSGCHWLNITETAGLSGAIVESVSLIASKRLEV